MYLHSLANREKELLKKEVEVRKMRGAKEEI